MNEWSLSVVSDSLRHHGLQPTRLLCPWNFPGKSTGVCCHFLLQGIFPTQGSNPGLPHCSQTLHHLSHQGNPCISRYLSIFISFLSGVKAQCIQANIFFFVKFDSNWAFPLSFLEYHILFIWAAMIWDAWFTVTLLLQLSSLEV